MSPEQIRSTKDVDLRTDIYSLGVTIYQLLAGHLPYTLGNEDTEFAIMEKIIRESPKFINGISNQMNELIKKACAKEPLDRFSSMEEMLGFLSTKTKQDKQAASQATTIENTASELPEIEETLPSSNSSDDSKSSDEYSETIIEAPQKPINFTETINNIDFEMLVVEGGSFMMGSDESKDEQPIHRVSLDDYYIGKFPVTQEL